MPIVNATPTALLAPQGGALLKVLVSISITGLLITADLEKRKLQQVALNRKIASSIPRKIENILRSWLNQPNTIAYSFGHQATTALQGIPDRKQIKLFATAYGASSDAPSLLAIEALPLSSDFIATYLLIPNPAPTTGGQLKLMPGQASNLDHLIGSPDGQDDIQNIGAIGKVYIKAMWVENFRDSWSIAGDILRGVADLKLLIWIFTHNAQSRDAKNSWDCSTHHNCLRRMLTMPIDIALTETGENAGKIIKGSFGLECNAPQEVDLNLSNCDSGYFFNQSISLGGGRYTGRCCRPVQKSDLQ